MSGEVATVLIEPVEAPVVLLVGRLDALLRSASTYADPIDCVVATVAESDDVLAAEPDFVIVRSAVVDTVPESVAVAVPFVRNELARAGAVVCAA